MISVRRILVTISGGVALCIGSATDLRAQKPPSCSYDRCALRVKSSFFGTSIVQGRQEDHLASITFFAPGLPQLAERSDSAAALYAAFRGRQNRGTVLTLVGLVSVIVGAAVAGSDQDWGMWAIVPGGILTLAGVQQWNSGRDRLSRAVWEYNRTLSPP